MAGRIYTFFFMTIYTLFYHYFLTIYNIETFGGLGNPTTLKIIENSIIRHSLRVILQSTNARYLSVEADAKHTSFAARRQIGTEGIDLLGSLRGHLIESYFVVVILQHIAVGGYIGQHVGTD